MRGVEECQNVLVNGASVSCLFGVIEPGGTNHVLGDITNTDVQQQETIHIAFNENEKEDNVEGKSLVLSTKQMKLFLV